MFTQVFVCVLLGIMVVAWGVIARAIALGHGLGGGNRRRIRWRPGPLVVALRRAGSLAGTVHHMGPPSSDSGEAPPDDRGRGGRVGRGVVVGTIGAGGSGICA
jgi:hypothetical protein